MCPSAQIQMDDKPFERDPASAEDAEVPNGCWDAGLNMIQERNETTVWWYFL